MGKERVHVFVEGVVQGVFFRATTKKKALSFNVKGWVRNIEDGRVEAVFEGESEDVKKILDFVSSGPIGAKVINVIKTKEDYVGEFSSFSIK